MMLFHEMIVVTFSIVLRFFGELVQRYSFLYRTSKKMSSQKIHIFKCPSKRVHKKFTNTRIEVENGGGKYFDYLFVNEEDKRIKYFQQPVPT